MSRRKETTEVEERTNWQLDRDGGKPFIRALKKFGSVKGREHAKGTVEDVANAMPHPETGEIPPFVAISGYCKRLQARLDAEFGAGKVKLPVLKHRPRAGRGSSVDLDDVKALLG